MTCKFWMVIQSSRELTRILCFDLLLLMNCISPGMLRIEIELNSRNEVKIV